ncbi:MAG: translation initiation factor IF-2B subunit alpha [Thermococci archaeon]|nr:translation initiation factor IF-2B subunit alpha [Thermococci archaeon]
MLPPAVVAIIREMEAERIRGASWLAKKGAEAYIALSESMSGRELIGAIKELGERIRAVNSTMASLYNLTRYVPVTADPSTLRARAEEFIKLCDEAKREIGNIGSELIDENEVVITHSFSSTVLEILKTARDKGKEFRVVITESSPDCEGLALAGELDRLGVHFDIITDAQLGLFAGKATLALVGADNVTRDGYVFNKAGTYLLSLACHDGGVPFYVAAESFKLHPELTAEEVDIVERPYAKRGYKIRNFLFDVTPWRYIRGVITELGILVPPKDL